MARYILTTGESFQVVPQHKNGPFTAQELQAFVGGFIEVVNLGRNHWLVVNEDGLRLELPLNEVATRLVRRLGLPHTIVGDALLCAVGELD